MSDCNCLLASLEGEHLYCFPTGLLKCQVYEGLADALLSTLDNGNTLTIKISIALADTDVEIPGYIQTINDFKSYKIIINEVEYNNFEDIKEDIPTFNIHMVSLGYCYSDISIPITCLIDEEYLNVLNNEKIIIDKMNKMSVKLMTIIMKRDMITTKYQGLIDSDRKVNNFDIFIKRHYTYYKHLTPTCNLLLGNNNKFVRNYGIQQIHGTISNTEQKEVITAASKLNKTINPNSIAKDDWYSIGRALDHILEGYPLKELTIDDINNMFSTGKSD